MLKRVGYTKTENKEDAGIILFNTCCVRENAENKVFGNLGSLKHLKKENPDLIIGICGCMMQQEGMADKILKKFPYVNIVFGTHNAYKFPEYLNRVKTEGVQIKEIFKRNIFQDLAAAKSMGNISNIQIAHTKPLSSKYMLQF